MARVVMACIVAAVFVAVSGAWTGLHLDQRFGVATAGDRETERSGRPDPATVVTEVPSWAARPFGHDLTLTVRKTARPDIVVVTFEASETERLYRGILDYVAEIHPRASMRAFGQYPALLVVEAERTNIDHCLALAQAQAESDFRPDAVGAAGEIGLYQMMPSTARIFEPYLGKFRRPSLRKYDRDLGDLADPLVSTRFAMAYLRDILARKPDLRDALTEYNGGPRARLPHYYRRVMTTYAKILERPELSCRWRDRPAHPPLLAFAR